MREVTVVVCDGVPRDAPLGGLRVAAVPCPALFAPGSTLGAAPTS